MTLTNREIFYRDPTKTNIPNDGVAKVANPETEEQWATLEWELKSFVCEGEYERSLERILSSYLSNLAQPQQPAVWLSGFYGSGKSHLLRVLEYLWLDTKLPSGESAQSLAELSGDIRDNLRELGSEAKRQGGKWSAAGTLAAGRNNAVRLAFLSILFESAGLPEQYHLARFLLWLRENDYLDSIEAHVQEAGKSLDKEINHLYVSPVIASGLLQVDPSLGKSVEDVRDLLKVEFPPNSKDITDDQMFQTMEEILALMSTDDGKLPLTLVVLDEMQQYIGEDNEKALAVQNIVEGCSSRFGSRVLVVAAGQSALTETATLSKLTDRFSLQVHLSDSDVESVVRKVVLRKKPEHVDEIKAAMDAVSGEIDQQLGGTQIAAKAADRPDWVPDYPLLPTRRRFWEHSLRAIDRAGKAGVLRTQLKMVHEAARAVADEPVGHVVGGDFIYEQQSVGMQHTNVLLKEIDELIRGLRDEDADGPLKSRICALIFLISQIPHTTLGGDMGLRATSGFLADLLVEDLASEGSVLRKKVPELLDELAATGQLMKIDDEYRLQTEEGAEWEKEFLSRSAIIRDDAARVSTLREQWISSTLDKEVGGLKLTQGASNTPRTVVISTAQEEPNSSEGGVPVWFRDGWSVSETAAKKTAAEAGDESPTVFVFLPKLDGDQVKEALADHAAAEETVQQKPVPQTDEGRVAELSMRTRIATSRDRLEALFSEMFAHARVFQGGGNELTKSSLRDAVVAAAQRSFVRLYPRFGSADNPNWGKVVAKAKDGAPDALVAVDHQGEPNTNLVCKEVMASISAGGTPGAELHKKFSSPPYGWPKDAVNGAVLTLLAAGNIRATAENGSQIRGAKELAPSQIGKVLFYKEDEPPSVGQRLAVRGLLKAANIDFVDGSEGDHIPALLQHLKDLSSRAGGPAPLPPPPSTDHLDALLAVGGNQQFKAVADEQPNLKANLDTWTAAESKREKREAELSTLERLLRHAESLPVAEAIRSSVRAVREGRQLLDDPDPIKPLLDDIAGPLRSEVIHLANQLSVDREESVKELEAWPEWQKLSPEDREATLAESQLMPEEEPDIETDAKLIQSLDAVSLASWQDRISLVPARCDQARLRAAKLLEPESVSVNPPSATLKTAADLDTYLEELRKQVLPHLEDEKTVVI